MMRSLFSVLIAALLIWLAWTGWHPPESTSRNTLRITSPNGLEKAMPWRVVTRRVISRPSSQGMRDQFSQAGLEPVIFSRNEAVELHAFDDPQTFTTMGEAAQVRNEWLRLKVKADIIKKDGRFHVALGRFIMTAHAAQMQAHLKKTGRPFSYEKRRIVIPVHRFTFPSLPQNQAQHLWEKVKELGFADPVLMSEKQFADIYELTESGHPAK